MSELCVWDLDGTMRPGNLMSDAITHAAEAGLVDITRFANPDDPIYPELSYFVRSISQHSRNKFAALMDRLSDEATEQAYPWAVERVEAQTAAGDHPIIVSQAPAFLVRAFARGVAGIRYARGSFFETQGLAFTGKAITLDKVTAVKRYARTKGFIGQIGFAAGDSQTDIPILRLAKSAVIVNPNEELAELATLHGWEIVSAGAPA